MRLLLSFLLALTLILPSLAQAYDILVVESRREPAYEEVLKGFRSVRHGSERMIVLSDYAETDIARIVREDRPGLVLAVGDSALAAARRIRQTPVVALMALGIHDRRSSLPNISGVGMFAQPESYMAIFHAMKRRRIGVIHDPVRSGWYLRSARQAAEKMGFELVVREVSSPRETLNRLDALKGKVDALWMLPDTTAVTRETAEAYFRFSQNERVPLVSFAGAYLGLGAAAVLEIDRSDLGRQAAEMAASILKGADAAETPVSWPRKTTIKINQSVLKHLGITFGQLELSATVPME